jgi:uncharacterized membrane protein (DUF2068 family)
MPTPTHPQCPPQEHAGLRLIALVKFLKALLLLAIAFGSHRLVNRDLTELSRQWAANLRIDPENHYARMAIERFTALNPHELRKWTILLILFAADQVLEGFGLWFNQAWAKYLVLIATGLFILHEAYGLIFKAFAWGRIPMFLGGIAVFWYLAWVLRQDHWRKTLTPPGPAG